MSAITSLESLSGLVAFSVTLELGSFAAAGRKLGLSASAVGKAVDRLEQRLGVKLLTRTTRSLTLTGEGEILYRYASRILSDLQEAERELLSAQNTPQGRLKISVPTVMGRSIVLPALGTFAADYPDVTLEISLDDLKVDLIEGGYDLVVRLGELEDSNLHARRIGPHAFTTCASPSYFAKHGTPQTPADLGHHCCVLYRFPTTGLPEKWAFKGEYRGMIVKPGIVLNDGGALASAALAGLGIVQAPRYLVAEDIEAGRLVSILDEFTDNRGTVSIVWPSSRTKVARVRAFVNFISQCLAGKI
ncbi:LysR family transcriptional regulator [Thalassospira xiamenensis]|uniref:LysR family transcriptional regulator n=1 Tax=Thalassospira xiamenensis TaxID=220697 RepID=UPI001FFF4AFF|nr:LysR family transcriptional regulator [Thalassospira xiamenensis]MCK2165949.1 LysR substrate-binding domain-containing protein [Thalassospira xiamenensis]